MPFKIWLPWNHKVAKTMSFKTNCLRIHYKWCKVWQLWLSYERLNPNSAGSVYHHIYLWILRTYSDLATLDKKSDSQHRGAIGIFGFAVLDMFFDRFFGFCVKRRRRFFGFGVQCSLRIFRFFSIWCSVFVKNTVLVLNVVFGFSYLYLFGCTVLYAVFGFGRFCLRFCGFWMNFSSVLRFLVYPNPPLNIGCAFTIDCFIAGL